MGIKEEGGMKREDVFVSKIILLKLVISVDLVEALVFKSKVVEEDA